MQQKIEQYRQEIQKFTPSSADEAEQFRIKWLGRKGIIGELFEEFKQVSPDEKKLLGKTLNELKQLAESRWHSFKENLTSDFRLPTSDFDLTLPGDPVSIGSRHPISLVRNEIISIFSRIGFTVAEGPEIEDDWHNFSALNFPEEHPARDMQDTFFISLNPHPSPKERGEKKFPNGNIALRTHTSSVQIRMMENGKPPFRAIMPGRVFRNEAISARAHCIFHQVEGLYVDERVSFADLKQTLYYFVQEMFGKGTEVRFRPSFFPVTEPSAEMDISCKICGGTGCTVCKYSGWVEILGCGMVHPNVLENCGIDSRKYTGFAFGMGIERLTMLRYGVKDLRLFFENDIRFLQQFQSEIS